MRPIRRRGVMVVVTCIAVASLCDPRITRCEQLGAESDGSAPLSADVFQFNIPAGWHKAKPNSPNTAVMAVLLDKSGKGVDGMIKVDVAIPKDATANDMAKRLAGQDGKVSPDPITVDGLKGIKAETSSTDLNRPRLAVVVLRDNKAYLIMGASSKGVDISEAFDHVLQSWKWSTAATAVDPAFAPELDAKTPSDFVEHKIANANVALRAPKDWRVGKTTEGVKFSLLIDSHGSTLKLGILPAEPDMTIPVLLQTLPKGLSAQFQDFKLIKADAVKLQGEPAGRLVYDVTAGKNIAIRLCQFMVLKNGKQYVLSFTTCADGYEKIAQQIDQVAVSLRVGGASTQPTTQH